MKSLFVDEPALADVFSPVDIVGFGIIFAIMHTARFGALFRGERDEPGYGEHVLGLPAEGAVEVFVQDISAPVFHGFEGFGEMIRFSADGDESPHDAAKAGAKILDVECLGFLLSDSR